MREAAAECDLVITMLPSSANVEAVYLGFAGIIESATAGRLCVEMSTIDPGTSQRVAARLKERGVRFLDAPVSGGVGGAVAGTLAIMIGGDAADLEEARPALAAMGSNIIHVAAVGAGEVAKFCNNLISGSALVAVAEAFRIGEAFGVTRRSSRMSSRNLRAPPGSWSTGIRSRGSIRRPHRAAITHRGS